MSISDVERAAAQMFCVGFTGTRVPVEMRRLIDRGVSAAILFKHNFTGVQQIVDLCAELKQHAGRPFLIGVDQEGGRVLRLGPPFTQIPSMRAVGRTNDPEIAHRIGGILGRELRAANIDLCFSPVLDVDTNPLNPVIADRSFGRTPELVARMGLSLIDGLQAEAVAACGKHFPGHGDTSQDSHIDLPRLPHEMSRLHEIELPPFAAAIKAGVAAIMTSHVIFEAIDPKYPATMSRAVLTRLLREQMGFDGVIVSDDLEMKAIANHFTLEEVIIRGANAGVDMFAICHSPAIQNQAIDILIKAIERGDVAREAIDAAARRLDRLYAYYCKPATSGPLSEVIGCPEHQQLVEPFLQSGKQRDPTEYIAHNIKNNAS